MAFEALPLPVAVIGGGISGLAAAGRLLELDCSGRVRLLEAGSRVGGVLQTNVSQGFVWESAADGFHGGATRAWELCQRVGLQGEILPAEPCAQPVQVVCRGELFAFPLAVMSKAPASARSILGTPVLSWLGKLRVLGERWVAPNDSGDETCASFFRRRFGREFYERLMEPIVSGIYSADPARLSMQALFPHLREWERKFGSLTAASRHQKQSARSERAEKNTAGHSGWTLRRGMSSLTGALAARLPAGTVELGAPVHQLRLLADGTWRIDYGAGRTLAAAAVVLATPAHRAAHLLNSHRPRAARLLAEISYSSVAVIALGFRRDQFREPPTSHGFFVPEAESGALRSASFTSLKYAGRAPQGAILIRACLGGDHHSSIIAQRDVQLIESADEELRRFLKIDGRPILAHVTRQLFAIPQYRFGHRELIESVGRRLADLPSLALAGNAYNGIGVPQCIDSGWRAAEQIHAHLHATRACRSAVASGSLAALTREPAHA